MHTAESYLKPEVIRTVGRLDLRARFIVEGFLSGLHASPFHGFSVEFSEHRRYAQGDDLKDIDWLVFAKNTRHSLPPASRRTPRRKILASLSKLKATGPTEIAKNLQSIPAMIRHRSL